MGATSIESVETTPFTCVENKENTQCKKQYINLVVLYEFISHRFTSVKQTYVRENTHVHAGKFLCFRGGGADLLGRAFGSTSQY